MGRDRSLDEFFGGESDADDPADAVEGADEPEPDGATGTGDGDAESESATGDSGSDDGLPDASAVDPATSTLRWSSDGAACDACGATVERRWEDDGAFVCGDCKTW